MALNRAQKSNSAHLTATNVLIPIPVDYNWVKTELLRLDRAFQIARDVYSSAFPDFKHGYDARITVYSKCANFISSATLGAQFMLDSLSRDEWWEKTEPWATLQRQPNYKKWIPPREYDLFLRLGLVVGFFPVSRVPFVITSRLFQT